MTFYRIEMWHSDISRESPLEAAKCAVNLMHSLDSALVFDYSQLKQLGHGLSGAGVTVYELMKSTANYRRTNRISSR